uniref:Uncharacterized protein n=1 Tax=Marseillevirus LCMAC102 TaxID=2506603 RepID=A0A481YTM3_9VIRU|nr:MAG: hypothetical protein LCMAC102_01650 [Marseillevirus LCMAC102]
MIITEEEGWNDFIEKMLQQNKNPIFRFVSYYKYMFIYKSLFEDKEIYVETGGNHDDIYSCSLSYEMSMEELNEEIFFP